MNYVIDTDVSSSYLNVVSPNYSLFFKVLEYLSGEHPEILSKIQEVESTTLAKIISYLETNHQSILADMILKDIIK